MDQFSIPQILIVLVIVWAVFGGWKRGEKKRVAELQIISRDLGFEFQRDGTNSSLSSYLSIWDKNGKIRSLLKGTRGIVQIEVFDYQHPNGESDAITTVFAFRSESLVLPNFRLRPRRFLDRVAAKTWAHHIDFASNQKFSKLYTVLGERDQSIQSIFTENIVAYLILHGGTSIEWDGQSLFRYEFDKAVSPENISACLDSGLKLVDSFSTQKQREWR